MSAVYKSGGDYCAWLTGRYYSRMAGRACTGYDQKDLGRDDLKGLSGDDPKGLHGLNSGAGTDISCPSFREDSSFSL